MEVASPIRLSGLEPFWDRLRSAVRRVLLLDYDGTLAPFTIQRENAEPYTGVREALVGIIDAGSRVVLVTGRSARNLLTLLRLTRTPEIWGAHGMERLHPDGRLERIPLRFNATRGLKTALERARQAGFQQQLERKYGCLALHWRGMSPADIQVVESEIVRRWSPLTQDGSLEFRRFDGGLELRAAGHGKGEVVQMVLAEEKNRPAAAYLGDDLTDEDAFRAVKGCGLALLVRSEWRKSEADAWIRPPDELLEFLHRWREICDYKSR